LQAQIDIMNINELVDQLVKNQKPTLELSVM